MTSKERLKEYVDKDIVYNAYKNGNVEYENIGDFEKYSFKIGGKNNE